MKRPERVTLQGSSVKLVPLTMEHAEAMFPATADPDLWRYLFDGPYADRESFDAHWRRKAESSDPLFFSILDVVTAQPLGHVSLMRIEPAHRVIEAGNILYSPVLQRTRGATEAMYLLASYVFDQLGYRRYEWKCDSRNEPSRRAAARLGFEFEGIFRQHMLVKGCNRDTAWYSMLDREWPSRKRAFERWLEPSNFDSAGRQIKRLAELR